MIISNYISAHSCSHDDNEEIAEYHSKYSEYFFKKINESNNNNQEDNSNKNRNLQAKQSQKIRITVDYSPINLVTPQTITPFMLQYIKDIVSVSTEYFSNLLKVVPIQGNNIYPKDWSSSCLNVNVPQNDIINGVPNSDLHIYITYINNPRSAVLSSASFCAMNQQNRRPSFGRIQYNIGILANQLSQSNSRFQDRVESTIHEIMHILGFSQFGMMYWIDPSTNSYYGQSYKQKILKTSLIRGLQTDILYSQNVLQTARKYYGCSSMEGMQLENQGGLGGAGSHWEKVITMNEIMISDTVPSNAAMSIFTIALLKDTGFFTEVNENMANTLSWGKGKGCSFVNNACKSTQNFPEFVQSTAAKGCTYEGDGYGTGINSATMDGCYAMASYNNKICQLAENNNLSNNKYSNERLESFGTTSRCFQSTATSGYFIFSDSARCHQMECAPDFSSITITLTQLNQQVVCKTQGAEVKIVYSDGTDLGSITCPKDFKQFCGFEPQCKNQCSSKGYCVQGYCTCIKGFAGEDCSLQCPFFSQNGVCVTQCSPGFFAAQDNTCRSFCPQGFYKNNGLCSPCHSSCSQCTGPTENQCTSCQLLTYLDNSTCVSSCPQGKYTDENIKACIQCSNGCLNCINSTICLQCNANSGFYLKNSQCVSNVSPCGANCISCSDQNSQICSKCMAGYFMNQQSQCVSVCPTGTYGDSQSQLCSPCSIIQGCTQCQSSKTCTVCNQQQGYRLQNGTCTLCAQQCLTCLQTNINMCLSCSNTAQLLYNNQCLNTCPVGTYPDYSTNSCIACNLKGCLQCSSSTKCTQCNSSQGYSLQNNLCVQATQCNYPCQTCTASSPNYCRSCPPGMYLFYGQCYQTCPQETYPMGNTCEWCQYGCLKCLNDSKCLQCDTYFGWQMFGDYCVTSDECYSPCKTCKPFQPTTCIT